MPFTALSSSCAQLQFAATLLMRRPLCRYDARGPEAGPRTVTDLGNAATTSARLRAWLASEDTI